jgi:hypothetical protein
MACMLRDPWQLEKPCNALTQVLMEQLWGYIYTIAKHPHLDNDQLDECHFRNLLRGMNEYGVRWWDPANWPQDLVDGKWEQVCPVAFLVANLGNLRPGSLKMLMAICNGTLNLPHAAAPAKLNPQEACCMIFTGHAHPALSRPALQEAGLCMLLHTCRASG